MRTRLPLFGILVLCAATAIAQKPYRGAEYRTLAEMTYGRFEVRMKSAPVSGMLSSFFTYYNPASPWNEIDIEAMGRYSNETQFNTIVPTQNDNHVHRQVLPFNPHAAFHMYAIEWTPSYVAWLVDGTEVYRQTGTHIAQLTKPQRIMMNVWQPTAVDWAGAFSASQLPVYAYYDWVRYSSYTPGVNDDFTLQWTDEFTAFDAGRWQKATHTWEGNNAQFVQENAAFRDGYLVLCLTSSTTSGYSGGAVVDTDVDPPTAVSAVLLDSTIVVRFSERVLASSAQNAASYSGGALTYTLARLLEDQKTVELSVSGTLPLAPFPLIAQNIADTSGHSKAFQVINVALPPALPVTIDVAGPGLGIWRPDSVWSAGRNYGAIGGIAAALPPATPIAGTTEPDLFRTSLHGVTGYKVRVPNGSYKVSLLMAEDRHTAAGQRVFGARAEGEVLFTHLDLVQQAGARTAYVFVAPAVTVTDRVLDLSFEAELDSATLSGLRIERAAGTSGVRQDLSAPAPRFGLAIYPNPFNASAVLRYTVERDQPVSLAVQDVLGRRVVHVDFGTVTAGVHEFHLQALSLPSGVYFCTLSGIEREVTQRVILMR